MEPEASKASAAVARCFSSVCLPSRSAGRRELKRGFTEVGRFKRGEFWDTEYFGAVALRCNRSSKKTFLL